MAGVMARKAAGDAWLERIAIPAGSLVDARFG
jgi:hypothetical protein